MSKVLIYQWKAQPLIPPDGFQGPQNVYKEAVPSWSRPETNGSYTDEQHNSYQGCQFRARPLKIWRKRLDPSQYSGVSKSSVGIPFDRPSGSVYLGNLEDKNKSCACSSDKSGMSIKTHILKWPTISSSTPNSNNSDLNVCCNPETNIIKSGIQAFGNNNTFTTIDTNNPENTKVHKKKYYYNSSGYLHARCKQYEQNLGTLAVVVNESENTYQSLTCPDGGCGLTSSSKPVLVYKPSNPAYMVQGAVSSSDRIARVRMNAIKVNAKSHIDVWGHGGLNLITPNPYFLKSKFSNTKYRKKPQAKTICVCSDTSVV